MTQLEKMGLVYKWDEKNNIANQNIQILDTSLRDGLQDPSIKQPTLENTYVLLEYFNKIGINSADIGFPVSSPKHKKDVIAIAKYIKAQKLNIQTSVLARTQLPDIQAAIDVSQAASIHVEAITILGSSKVRQLVEKWDYNQMKEWIKESISLAIKNNLSVNFLTEDGTRTEPDVIKDLYKLAIDCGATTVTIADTVGDITPKGTKNIIIFLKDEVIKGEDITIDFHGHNDRELAVANSLEALYAGANRIHTTVLGIGERAGNTDMESMLINLHLLNTGSWNLDTVQQMSEHAAKMFGVDIPYNTPVIGNMVHSTAVGIHASAIQKARNMDREDLANTVYSGVNAQLVGRKTEIHIGPLSGKANVEYVLSEMGIEVTETRINKLLNYARENNTILHKKDLQKLLP